MRYELKQKLLSWGDDYYIRDSNGKDVYFVDGKALSFGDQLSFQDLAGNELAFIKQRLLAWGKTYEISRGGEIVAVVHRERVVDGSAAARWASASASAVRAASNSRCAACWWRRCSAACWRAASRSPAFRSDPGPTTRIFADPGER